MHGDLTGPFDGSVDRIAGHGTFIAGLVHQVCPDAEILAWRAIPAKAPLIESEWLTTLAQVIELVRRHREGEPGGHPIDVLSLSMGYYHENESDDLLDPILLSMIDKLQQLGVAVVCSAGNDATDRPCYPAAFAPWRNGRGPVKATTSRVPLVSVGAQNPNTTDALFTNAGTWVRAYAPGAPGSQHHAARSTGGLDPLASKRHPRQGAGVHRSRRLPLPRDARGRRLGGFGLWSGTSFAAPVVAGRIAARCRGLLMAAPTTRDAAAAGGAPGEAVEDVDRDFTDRIGGCGAPHELHQAGLEALVGRRLPTRSAGCSSRRRAGATDPDLTARIDASLSVPHRGAGRSRPRTAGL